MKDICFQMGVMPTAIYRLEKGSSNFEMGNMMSYIKALQHILVIENGQHSYRTNDAQELGSILALIRKEKAISQRALAEKTGFVYSTIVKIESKKSIISIDTMLKIVDVLGYTVKIEKNNCYGCVHLCYYLDYYNVGTNVSIWVIRESPKTVVKRK